VVASIRRFACKRVIFRNDFLNLLEHDPNPSESTTARLPGGTAGFNLI
jgi:hypothetical protein